MFYCTFYINVWEILNYVVRFFNHCSILYWSLDYWNVFTFYIGLKMYFITARKYLSNIEYEQLKTRIENNWRRDVLIIKLGLATGARAQELLNITHSDLNSIEQSVYIKGLKRSDDREIPIENTLFNALKALPLNETLFNCSYSWLVKVWAKYTHGITDKPFKSTRHTYAMRLYEKTQDLLLVQAALGHREIGNTLVYAEHFYKNQLLHKLKV